VSDGVDLTGGSYYPIVCLYSNGSEGIGLNITTTIGGDDVSNSFPFTSMIFNNPNINLISLNTPIMLEPGFGSNDATSYDVSTLGNANTQFTYINSGAYVIYRFANTTMSPGLLTYTLTLESTDQNGYHELYVLNTDATINNAALVAAINDVNGSGDGVTPPAGFQSVGWTDGQGVNATATARVFYDTDFVYVIVLGFYSGSFTITVSD
jgi:hypothetical protein